MKRLLLLSFLLVTSAEANTLEYFSGTGFYVSTDGHVITNEHVVQNCKEVTLKEGREEIPAELIDVDKKNDLALIKSSRRPKRVATLRYEQNLQKGDVVTIMGFPVENNSSDHFRIRTAKIIDIKGPTGQVNWLQFTDALKKGNSGGPLLDQYGNVIGVVRGKAQFVEITYQTDSEGNRREISRGPEQNADIAINLPVLTEFLADHFVAYNNMLNYDALSATEMQAQGQQYIINVQCLQ